MNESEFEHNLEKYAELVVKIGANVQPGQLVHIDAPIEAAPCIRFVVKKAYEAGAKYVHVEWDDEEITKTRFAYAPDDSFAYYPEWVPGMLERLAENGGAFIQFRVPDPDLHKGADPGKVKTAAKAAVVARQKFQGYVRNKTFCWTIAKVATRAWSAKVFPELAEEERVPAMWDLIFKMNRVDTPDPIAAWQDHIGRLRKVKETLNAKKFALLHYRAPGTDLTVELPEGHVWHGGGTTDSRDVFFVANMPTEEVYTMPKRTGVNGTVTSTLPLNLNGRLVDKFSFTFREGQIVDFQAETGLEHLTALLDTDEGAKFLGEVALVPQDSPIARLNRVFYNTGLDENASCHFAVGSAYPFTIENGTQMTKEELLAKGANVSLAHTDFMVGSAELDIDGVLADGTVEPVFRKGNWAVTE